MLFNSFIFLFFFTIVLAIYYYSNASSRKIVLLVSSYIFYAYWDYRFCGLLLLTTLIDYYSGKFIYLSSDKSLQKKLLLVSLISNLGILGLFKYFNFFVESFDKITGLFGYNLDYLHLNIILPIGISFYTFKSLTYTIDIYRGELKPANTFIDYAIFVSFFPQLLAGPIERAKNLLPQIAKMATPTKEQFRQGFVLITVGMLKKVLIGDTTGRIVDQIFAQPQYYASAELLMGLLLFSIQIYADFSGYSSIARGLAKWLGFETMINFNQPYLSASITEFWRRWHISLSTWFRDYLFLPLAYSTTRKMPQKKYLGISSDKVVYFIAIMITFLICGLWHGASWTFVVWGGLHGIYLIWHRFIMKGKRVADSYKFKSYSGLSIFILKVLGTNILILITWLFFRQRTFGEVSYFIERLINWESGDFDSRVIMIILSFSLVTLLIDSLEYYFKEHEFLLRLKPEYRYGFAAACWLMILLYMFQAVPMPFIYSQF